MTPSKPLRPGSILRRLLSSEAGGGIVLMAAAAAALIVANSPLAKGYFAALEAHVGPLSVLHWINDALMALFFLLVGLEIKREMIGGELSTWRRRALPGLAAAGGMIAPALVYLAFAGKSALFARGWAIPAATDIAFALGVLALIGSRAPASLKIFLAALAIMDDLGAVAIIALFYSAGLSWPMLGGAAVCVGGLAALSMLPPSATKPGGTTVLLSSRLAVMKETLCDSPFSAIASFAMPIWPGRSMMVTWISSR